METLSTLSLHHYPAAAVVLLGLALVWRGLVGGRHDARGMLRRDVATLERVEGWRIFLLGLTVTGLGLAWSWGLRWLLVLSLGMGFVEMQEATHVIKAWRWDGKPPAR